MSIASELTALAANKAAIKAAIEAKNPSTMPTDALSQWPTSIASIGGGGHEGWIYGYVIDESDSNPATRVTYIEDNADFGPLYMDFANDALVWGDWQDFVEEYFRPAMLKSDGTIDYYLDPNNLTKKADGVTASDVANTSYDGNAMLIVKPIFYNIARISPTQIRVRFSNVKQGDSWYNWTHLKSDGTYAEFCGWPLFQGTMVSSKLRSMATGSAAAANSTQASQYAAATANGNNWYPTLWADEMMIRLLFPLLCKSTNSDASVGTGATGSLLAGALADKGGFWGLSTLGHGVKFLWMEYLWGSINRRSVGINIVDGWIYVKMTPSTIDGSLVGSFVTSDTASDYRNNYMPTGCSVPLTANHCISYMHSNMATAMVPLGHTGGTDFTKYYCDTLYSNSGTRAVLFGGDPGNGAGAGIFAFSAYDSPSMAYSAYGASLSYHFY